jgi:hypothetical protein
MKSPDQPAAAREGDAAQADLPEPARRRAGSETTVGTGSALAIGCIVAVLVLVVAAFAARWLLGVW